ncbi:hypothetical protein CONPUDRAFT_76142 [Coniophora puteana RWD-64-598 SS2]|uniref:Uncharacterized protein n=1 Tax=Coniophora puteana (strain RWD-64-598) TaxID=741705 RepID=A0A5M3MDW4_CONPW|nr:uncharacterized protein CONPUDRAFT_76142 [Coniophora puteana RWD-64-598 SS2]EIW77418.1 hypothetical protein CONPUDRAFT_76142 [Coniophora puteana RWD-64-598 SS2]
MADTFRWNPILYWQSDGLHGVELYLMHLTWRLRREILRSIARSFKPKSGHFCGPRLLADHTAAPETVVSMKADMLEDDREEGEERYEWATIWLISITIVVYEKATTSQCALSVSSMHGLVVGISMLGEAIAGNNRGASDEETSVKYPQARKLNINRGYLRRCRR